jgi:hypothetical protein
MRLSISCALALAPVLLTAHPGAVACAQQQGPEQQAEIVDPPYPADQIRDATQVGRRYVFRFEAAGQPTQVHTIEFVEVSERGCTMRRTVADAQGRSQGEPIESHATWLELEGHAHYPAADTTVEEAELEVPAGVFSCLLYVVEETQGGIESESRYYFARDLPGPPVKVVVSSADEVVFTMTLIDYDAP